MLMLKYFSTDEGWIIKGNYDEIRFRKIETENNPIRLIQCFKDNDTKNPAFFIREESYCSAYILNDEGKTIERIN